MAGVVVLAVAGTDAVSLADCVADSVVVGVGAGPRVEVGPIGWLLADRVLDGLGAGLLVADVLLAAEVPAPVELGVVVLGVLVLGDVDEVVLVEPGPVDHVVLPPVVGGGWVGAGSHVLNGSAACVMSASSRLSSPKASIPCAVARRSWSLAVALAPAATRASYADRS